MKFLKRIIVVIMAAMFIFADGIHVSARVEDISFSGGRGYVYCSSTHCDAHTTAASPGDTAVVNLSPYNTNGVNLGTRSATGVYQAKAGYDCPSGTTLSKATAAFFVRGYSWYTLTATAS